MERFVILPFSIGSCASQSSVEVIENLSKKTKPADPNPSSITGVQEGGGGESSTGVKLKNSVGILAIPKPNISFGIQKLIKSIKTFSQLFVYKEEEDGEDMEMEIGLPTDVKHVAHIGWDGSTNTTTTKNPLRDCFLWDNLKAHPQPDKDQDQLLSSSLSSTTTSISLRQFELAMAAQADHTHDHDALPPFVFGSSINKSTTC